MSDDKLPLLEEKSEWNDNEDECSFPRDLESEAQLAEEHSFSGFSSSFELINSPTNFHTLGTPEDTDSPVASPKRRSIVGKIKEHF